VYCPECRSEYRDGIYTCADCGVSLVEAPPTESDDELVTIFNTTDPALFPIIKSVLDAAGIPYVVQGEEHLGLFPLGLFGAAVSKRALGAIIRVPADRADETRELLNGVAEASPDDDQEAWSD
jgi:hypothetical protein